MEVDRAQLFVNHPKFGEYVDFLESSVKPECRGCFYLAGWIGNFSLSILDSSARLNTERTQIIDIDADIEEQELITFQEQLIAINALCHGPIVEDYDAEKDKSIVRQLIEDRGSRVDEERLELQILPVIEGCDLQRQLQKKD